MKCSTTYQVTPELQNASVRQFFFSVLLRPRLGALFFLVLAMVVLVVISPAYKMTLAAVFGGLCFSVVAMWVKSYFHSLKMAQDGLKIMEHPRVELNFDEEQIEYVSSTGKRIHRWDKVERVVRTKDFLVLMHGMVALLSLPKASVPAEVQAFLSNKISDTPAPIKAPRVMVVIVAVLGVVLALLGLGLLFLWTQL